MSESHWHKQLKRDANGFLATFNDGQVNVFNEVAVKKNGDLCTGGIPYIILDCVAFDINQNIIAAVECGTLRNVFRHYKMPFDVYHAVTSFKPPHLIGGCAYCHPTGSLPIPKDAIIEKQMEFKLKKAKSYFEVRTT